MAGPRRHPHVVSVEEVPAVQEGQGHLLHTAQRLGEAAGGSALGCSYVEVAPGKTGFPFHFHSALEEALYVLEGEGHLRIGQDVVKLKAGDYVALPAGPAAAHNLMNSGRGPLRYLALSGPATAASWDVVVYPDSRKVSFRAGAGPGQPPWVEQLIRQEQPPVGYFDDEPLAEDDVLTLSVRLSRAPPPMDPQVRQAAAAWLATYRRFNAWMGSVTEQSRQRRAAGLPEPEPREGRVDFFELVSFDEQIVLTWKRYEQSRSGEDLRQLVADYAQSVANMLDFSGLAPG